MARRVLPTPPVPVSVSSRTLCKKLSISASSRSRPSRGVGRAGRLGLGFVAGAAAAEEEREEEAPRLGTAAKREACSSSESPRAPAKERTV
jgi:hypothetical protein